MTYDMRGGFQVLTGHHTNLYTPTGDLFRISTDASVNLFVRAGVPKEKIVIGAAFYSRVWNEVPDRNHGLHQMAGARAVMVRPLPSWSRIISTRMATFVIGMRKPVHRTSLMAPA